MRLPETQEITAIVAPLLDRLGVPGAAVALVCGDQSWSGGFGVLNAETGKPVTDSSCFQIASLSKAYTATLVAMLVAEGKLGFDDPVRQHFPTFKLADENVAALTTLRDLLSMRLGVKPEGLLQWGRNQEFGAQSILERLPHVAFGAGFREELTYFNASYTLLASLVEQVTGTTFAEYAKQRLFDPLGMQDCFIQPGRLEEPEGKVCAMPHPVQADGSVPPLGELRGGGHVGESGVYSSARDAERWLRFHLGKGTFEGTELVPEAQFSQMHRPHVLTPGTSMLGHDFFGYGMGWQVRDNPGGKLLAHEGGEFGISSYTLVHPATGTGVSVYLNANVPAASRSLGHVFLDLMRETTTRDWEKTFTDLAEQERAGIAAFMEQAFPTEGEDVPLEEIEGRYGDAANGDVEVRQTPDGLALNVLDGWIYDALLTPLGGGTYQTNFHYLGTRGLARGFSRLRFARDEEGVMLTMPGMAPLRKL